MQADHKHRLTNVMPFVFVFVFNRVKSAIALSSLPPMIHLDLCLIYGLGLKPVLLKYL